MSKSDMGQDHGNGTINSPEETPSAPGVGWRRLLIGTLAALLLITFWGALLSGRLTAQIVTGGSMSPTLAEGDRLLIGMGGSDSVEVGDLVIVSPPEGFGSDLVKRIVAGPGDLVSVRGGLLYVNGGQSPHQGTIPWKHTSYARSLKVPDEHFYVLGDNRPISLDSEEFGPVPRLAIQGRVLWRFYPLARSGSIP